MIALRRIAFPTVRLRRHEGWLICCALLPVKLGIGGWQISSVNASIATAIRARPLARGAASDAEKIETALAAATAPAEEQWLSSASS